MIREELMNLSDFGLPGGVRKTLVVLGAGATRGASFVSSKAAPLPPLDLDFFQQVSRMPLEGDEMGLLRFVRSEFGNEIGLSMEEFLSQADYTDRFHRELNVDPGPHVKRYQTALESVMRVLPRLLHETTNRDCEYHGHLASLLHARDCVISFNYDCVMDRALRNNLFKRWDPDRGSYGFTISGGGDSWKDHTKGRKVKQPIRLLKLHGSLNWQRPTENEIVLVKDTESVDTLEDVVIPPTWFKDLGTFPYGEVWKQARKEIRSSRIIIVIGYSVPDTDLFSRSLFRVEAGSKRKREKLDLLVVVNPDRAARHRFLNLVTGGVEDSTVIREYETLADIYWVLERHGSTAGSRSVTAESVWSTLNPVARRALKRLTEDLLRENLTERERKILVLYYGLDEGEPVTVTQIGELLGIPAAEVEDIRERALDGMLSRH